MSKLGQISIFLKISNEGKQSKLASPLDFKAQQSLFFFFNIALKGYMIYSKPTRDPSLK